MAITQAMCTSFKVGLLNGEFDFSSGTSQVFKIALYTNAATLGAATTNYTTTDEVSSSGTGYSTGGKPLTITTYPTSGGTTAYLDFQDVTWTSASLTAAGALIYQDDGSLYPAIAVLSFGGDKTASAGDFTIQFPTADAANAIIRIA